MLGLAFKLTKSGPGFVVNRLALRFLGTSFSGLVRDLLEKVEAHPPRIVVPGHGPAVSGPDTAARTRAALEAAG